MAIRYSKFLGTILKASLQASSSAEVARQHPPSNPETGGTSDTPFDADDFAFGYDFDDVGTWDFPPDFEPVSNPVAWWDTSLGRPGLSRFP